jgi:hypothetical protein
MKASSEDFQFIRNARNSAKLTLALGFVALIVFPNPSHPSVTFNFDSSERRFSHGPQQAPLQGPLTTALCSVQASKDFVFLHQQSPGGPPRQRIARRPASIGSSSSARARFKCSIASWRSDKTM